MDVGKGCIVSDEWIPNGINTSLEDVHGISIKTADRVKLNGCTSRYAIVGNSMEGEFMLYFGSDNGSVGWYLNERVIAKHKVKVI